MRPRRTVFLVRAVAALSLVPVLLGTLLQWGGRQTHSSGGSQHSVDWMSGPDWRNAGLVALTVTAYLFFWLRLWPGRSRGRSAVAVLLALIAFAGTDQLWIEGHSGTLWLYSALVAGCVLRPRWSVPAVLAMATAAALPMLHPPEPTLDAGATVSAVHVDTLSGHSASLPLPGLATPLPDQLSDFIVAALPVLIAGFGAVLVTYELEANRELRAGRAALARLAVQEERARVARDLHDTLGHSLAVIGVRIQLAERLHDAGDPGLYAELGHVKDLARASLRAIRATVSEYRRPTVAAELAGAGVALEAAGIAAQIGDHPEESGLPPDVETACAWVIREGATNVLKHSGATRCRIEIRQESRTVAVTVEDDGTGADPVAGPDGPGHGNGLSGLRERIEAVGGDLTAGTAGMRTGWLLKALIPLAGSAPAPANRKGTELVAIHAD